MIRLFILAFLASYGSLLLEGQPQSSTNFGSVAVGTSSQSAVTVQGSLQAGTPTFQLRYRNDYSIASSSCMTAQTVQCTILVNFAPRQPGARLDVLIALDQNQNQLAVVSLSGTGTAGQIMLMPGVVSITAGTEAFGYAGDRGLAVNASLGYPQGLAVHPNGDLYIADYLNSAVRKVSSVTGIITTVVGTGQWGYAGDGSYANTAKLAGPIGLAFDSLGDLFIADSGNNAIRRVDASSGIISTVAGSGGNAGYDGLGDGGPALQAILNSPSQIAVDPSGNLFVADSYYNLVRKIDAKSGNITVVAGGGNNPGTDGFGNGGPALGCNLSEPSGVAVDNSGNLYIADTGNNMVRFVNSAGVVNALAGNGVAGLSGDWQVATQATLRSPNGLGFDAAGNLYVADTNNNVVRKIDAASGIISTIAGHGTVGLNGQTFSNAVLYSPMSIAADGAGSLYIADYGNNVVRKLSSSAVPLSFPTVAIRASSVPQFLAVSNTGNSALTLSAITATPNFSTQTTGAGACSASTSIAQGDTCLAAVQFAPLASGALTGALSIQTSPGAPGPGQVQVALSGTGVAVPAANFSVANLTFSNQNLNTSSPAQSVSLTNTGTGPLLLNSISLAGVNSPDFAQSSSCSSSLLPGSACTISILFAPSAIGSRSAVLSLNDNAPGAPHTLAITGTAIAVPVMSVSAPSPAFPDQTFGTTSASQSVTVSNTGAAPLPLSSITLAGPNPSSFPMTNNCGSALNPGTSCTIQLLFTPPQLGSYSATVTIASSQVPSQTVNLSGNGAALSPVKLVSLASGRVLDVSGASQNDGASIVISAYGGTDDQRWLVTAAGNGYYQILNKLSSKSLALSATSLQNGAYIFQWDAAISDNELWQILPIDGLNYKIVNKLSGKCLDVAGYSTSNGARIQQWDYLGGSNQKWQLVIAP